jgi:aerobic-type carbon monoxide dehydrogenase small subunit (CoxS/CutS family)
VTDYLTNPATLGTAEGMGATGGFGGSDESPRVSYTLRVNGLERPVNEAWIGESLLYVLRERLGLAGAKGGCDQGECGACSVQLDGQLTAACLVPAALAADSEIRTVEGLSADGGPSDVQRALAESGAVQCGYCVPGLTMAVHDLLERNHQPTDLQAREALCGNLCRCTGYSGALSAVQAVARSREAAAAALAAAAEEESAAEAAALAEAQAEAGAGADTGQAATVGPVVGIPAQAAAEYPVATGYEGAYEGSFEPLAEIASDVPVEHEQPVYVELPAQQTAEAQAQPAQQPQAPAEVDPLFGPMEGITGAGAPSPQYAGYPQAQAEPQQQHYYEQQPGEYRTGQFALPDYATGQFPIPDLGAGEYPTGEYRTGEFPTGEFPTGEFPGTQYPAGGEYQNGEYPTGQYATGEYAQPGYPQPGADRASESEPGVYVLPHQQQHTHAPAPEA